MKALWVNMCYPVVRRTDKRHESDEGGTRSNTCSHNMLLILGLGSKKAFLLEDQNMEVQVCGFESSDEKECLELIF